MSQTGDPFLDALRVLQPDVDIVALPVEPPAVEVPLGSPADADAAARGTGVLITTMLGESGLADPTDHPRRVFARWQREREDVHTHRTRARVEHDDAAAAIDSLLRAVEVLSGARWTPIPVDSPTPWFVAASPSGMQVDLAVERTHLVLTVTSPPLRLSEDPA